MIISFLTLTFHFILYSVAATHVSVTNDNKAAAAVNDDLVSQFSAFWYTQRLRPLAARDFLVGSVCPQLYGLHMYKLAVLLTLIGGVGQSSGELGANDFPFSITRILKHAMHTHTHILSSPLTHNDLMKTRKIMKTCCTHILTFPLTSFQRVT
jgi:hypothetical protein